MVVLLVVKGPQIWVDGVVESSVDVVGLLVTRQHISGILHIYVLRC